MEKMTATERIMTVFFFVMFLAAVHGAETNHLQTELVQLKADVAKLKAKNNEQEQRIQALEDKNVKQVMFHARLLSSVRVSGGQNLVLDYLSTNQGNAYNATTGQFTVPFNGTYFFTATTGAFLSYDSPNTADIVLVVDGSQDSFAYSHTADYYEQGTCSYAAVLTAGQKVWLEAWGDGFFDSGFTTFTGFLVGAN